MSILKYILSPFVEFKEKEEAQNETASQAVPLKKDSSDSGQTPAVLTDNPATVPSSAYPSTVAKAAAPAQYQKHFEDLIEEANTKNPLFQGTDFKEFIDSKIDVEAIGDDETRYRTAFNVLKRTGLTKEKLLTTGREYVNLVDNDLKAFENVYTQQYKTDVEGKEQLLQRKAEELQTLSGRITALNDEVKQLAQEITQNKESLTSNRASFVSAGEAKKQEIQTELQKINQYFS